MNGRRIETPHHTPEQVRDYCREALAIVAALDVPDDLRAPMLTKAAEMLAAKQITFEQIVPAGGLLTPPPRL